MAEMTPMMKQYLEIKQEYPDTILFFRLGDFYEMFFDDAKTASRELELTLTGKSCGLEERAPMCGVPFHSADSYIAKLVSKGYKVAICEQTEDPALAKGLVKRDVIRVVTKGSVIENSMLDDSKNNYLTSVYLSDNDAGICFTDISTGVLNVTSFEGKGMQTNLINELGVFSPSEIILNRTCAENKAVSSFISKRMEASCEVYPDEYFDYSSCLEECTGHFDEEKLAQSRQLLTGELIIGASDTVTKTYLVSRLEAFHQNYPAIQIRILNGTSQMVLDYLHAGQVDIAFASEPKDKDAYSTARAFPRRTG